MYLLLAHWKYWKNHCKASGPFYKVNYPWVLVAIYNMRNVQVCFNIKLKPVIFAKVVFTNADHYHFARFYSSLNYEDYIWWWIGMAIGTGEVL